MARNLFLSVLGTGLYEPCKYVAKDFKSKETRFVQEATLDRIGVADWQKEDRIVILLTPEAAKKNWSESIKTRFNFKTNDEETYEGLESVLQSLNLNCQIEGINIPNGSNEEEMWKIFSVIFSQINEGDNLYIELTHSFRYLPMLLLVLCNYAKFLKGVQVKYMSYGNFDARNRESNEAPLVDLLSLSSLQDWTFASANFLQNGNVEQLQNLCNNSLSPLLQDSQIRKSDPSLNTLRNYVRSLRSMVEDMQGCRGINILEGCNYRRLFNLSNQLTSVIIQPMNPIIEKMKSSFADFTPSTDIMNGYHAAQWCYEHNLYQQSLTILHENIVTHVCLDMKLQHDKASSRELVNKAFYIQMNRTPEENWKVATDEGKSIIKALLQNETLNILSSSFLVTTNLRNDYNHAGMRQCPITTEKLKNNLLERIGTINNLLSHKEKFRILINLSNHPYDSWSDKQKEAAIPYGECLDMPFPNILPSLTESDIENLATQYLAKIEEKILGKSATVHIMGEQTFSFCLTEKLLKHGIKCIASCAERNVAETDDGIKHVTFEFACFREFK